MQQPHETTHAQQYVALPTVATVSEQPFSCTLQLITQARCMEQGVPLQQHTGFDMQDSHATASAGPEHTPSEAAAAARR